LIIFSQKNTGNAPKRSRSADGNINDNKKCSSCEGTDHCRVSSSLCPYNPRNEKVI
jgi:hypothetical protein